MQSSYPERFEREMGCTEAEWLASVPRALGDYPYQLSAQTLLVQIGLGALAVQWKVGEPRVIALARIPRLLVQFGFNGLDEAQRLAFMQRFDLYMQRGGG
jgi:hypothetical protein